jgi:hypothetical protein
MFLIDIVQLGVNKQARVLYTINIMGSLLLFDCTTDGNYLVYRTSLEARIVFDLVELKELGATNSELELRPLSEGLLLIDQGKHLADWLEPENSYRHIFRLGDRALVTTDELGMVRSSPNSQIKLFEYPVAEGKGFFQVLTQHQNLISICVPSEDRQYLLTYSMVDK